MKSGSTGLPSQMVEKWSCTAEPIAIADYAVCTPILQIAKARRNTSRRCFPRWRHYAHGPVLRKPDLSGLGLPTRDDAYPGPN
jgi:hypothetical protein